MRVSYAIQVSINFFQNKFSKLIGCEWTSHLRRSTFRIINQTFPLCDSSLARVAHPFMGSHGESTGSPGFLRFLFRVGIFATFLHQDFPSTHFYKFWQLFYHDKKAHLSTKFSPPKICQTSTNFLRFDFSIEWTKFRQTLFFCASHYYYMPIIQKVYLFLTDKFRACSPFFFVTSQFYYNTKKFYFQPVYFKNFEHTL